MTGNNEVVYFRPRESEPLSTSADRPQNVALAENYLRWCELTRGRAATTLGSYGRVLRLWCEHLDQIGMVVTDVGRNDMEAFLRRPRPIAVVPSASTLFGEASALRGFYGWLHNEQFTSRDCSAGLVTPKRKGRDPKPIDDAHWKQLWTAPLEQRHRAMLGLGYFLGLRREEMFNLRAEQITDDSLIDVTRKGGSRQTLKYTNYLTVYERSPILRPLLITPAMFTDALGAVRRQGGWLIPGRANIRHPEAINKRFTRWCKTVGIPHITPHQLRHSAATNLARGGVPPHLIMGLLNHGTIDITMRYIRAAGADMDEWLRQHPDQ